MMDNYSLTLSSNNDSKRLEFAVLPQKLDISHAGNNKTYEISKLGEINIIKSPKLGEISMEGIFPVRWLPGANVSKEKEWKEPFHYIETIQKWRSDLEPIHLVFTGSTIDINQFVTIEKFNFNESAGAPGDIQYQLSFKIYRPYQAHKVQVTKSGAVQNQATDSTPRADTKATPKTYTLVAGDSLWKVAKKFLGDGSKYKQIQSLNGIKDSELKKLPIGKVIKLP
ncbi:LysM domain/BON superfamily protein [compost metagenome]